MIYAEVWPAIVQVPDPLQSLCRQIYELKKRLYNELVPIGDEIWCTHHGVSWHTDGCSATDVTWGLILCGSPRLVLEAEGRRLPLVAGSVYRIVGILPHRVVGDDFLAFLAWDMPRDKAPEDVTAFAREALDSAGRTVLLEPFPRPSRHEELLSTGIVRSTTE